VVGHLTAHGQEFGYEVQIIARSDIDGSTEPLTPAEAFVAITDVTTGRYLSQVFEYKPGQGTFSSTRLDESTPNATLWGPLNAMRLQASMPAGSIDLTLDAQGPAIYNGGNGLIPFLAGSSYYYSLTTVSTTGTIVEKGHEYKVSGQSWLDHQWGNWNWLVTQKWTWMGIQLSDGVSLDLWDIFSSGTENHYATVLEPDERNTSWPSSRWPPTPPASSRARPRDSATAASGACLSRPCTPASRSGPFRGFKRSRLTAASTKQTARSPASTRADRSPGMPTPSNSATGTAEHQERSRWPLRQAVRQRPVPPAHTAFAGGTGRAGHGSPCPGSTVSASIAASRCGEAVAACLPQTPV
jgi:CrtC N-terminal lipocalin domain